MRVYITNLQDSSVETTSACELARGQNNDYGTFTCVSSSGTTNVDKILTTASLHCKIFGLGSQAR